jgi:hypothetical protein
LFKVNWAVYQLYSLILNVQWIVFKLYARWEQVQQYINTSKLCRNEGGIDQPGQQL